MTLALVSVLNGLLSALSPATADAAPAPDEPFPNGGLLAIEAGLVIEYPFPIGTLRYTGVIRPAIVDLAFTSVLFVHAVDLGGGLALPINGDRVLALHGGLTVVPGLCDYGCVGWHYGVSFTGTGSDGRGARARYSLTHRRLHGTGVTTLMVGIAWSMRS